MRLLRAALLVILLLAAVGTDVLAVPVTSQQRSSIAAAAAEEQDRIDPLKSEDSLSDDVNRTKRRFKPEELAAANQVLDSLQIGQRRMLVLESTDGGGVPDTPSTTSAKPITTTKKTQNKKKIQKKKGKQARQASDDDLDEENGIAGGGAGDEDRPIGENGKVTLQIPGKLFGNATNLFLAAAKLLGDFITNSAIRSARFLQLFQPVFGRTLYIQIPTTTTESNDI